MKFDVRTKIQPIKTLENGKLDIFKFILINYRKIYRFHFITQEIDSSLRHGYCNDDKPKMKGKCCSNMLQKRVKNISLIKYIYI